MCVKTFFISFIFIILTVNCKIVVFYGTYHGSSRSVPNENLNWFDCVCWCQETNDCLFVFWNESSQVCNVVYSDSSEYLANIYYTNETTDMQIALKTNFSNCYEAIHLLKTRYISCQSEYSRTFRLKYTVCMKRFKYDRSLSFLEAFEKCSNEGATIVGSENDNERIFIADTYNDFMNTSSSTWIGLRRNSQRNFEWTDPSITGNGSIVWANGHPIDGNNCASLQSNTSFIQSNDCNSSPCDTFSFCPSIVMCAKLIG